MRALHHGLMGIAGVLLAGCSSADAPATASVTAAESAVVGQYNLVTANGATVPAGAGSYPINNVTCNRFVDGGFLRLGGQLDYNLSVSWRIVCPSGVSTTSTSSGSQISNGTWTYDGNQLALTRAGGSAMSVANLEISGGVVSADVQLETIPPDAAFKYPVLTMRFQR